MLVKTRNSTHKQPVQKFKILIDLPCKDHVPETLIRRIIISKGTATVKIHSNNPFSFA